jgi:flavin reductase (DIM6/NTAB) family NADH-FMN oxidoreductase RutF
VLADAAASIGADIIASHPCGDHTIFIGHIMEMRIGGDAPLVVHGGRYASVLYSEDEDPVPITDFW